MVKHEIDHYYNRKSRKHVKSYVEKSDKLKGFRMYRERLNETLDELSREEMQIQLTKTGQPLKAADFEMEFMRLKADFSNMQNERQ